MSLFAFESPVLGSGASVKMDSNDATTGTSSKKIVPFEVVSLSGLAAASATSGTIWVAPKNQPLRGQYAVAYVVVSVGVVSTSGTLDIVQAADGTAISSGTSVLASTVDLHAITAATATEAAMGAGITVLTVGAGNRLGYKLGGTLTGLADLNISVYLERI